jgi:small subunit ribosomal protein S5e
MVALGLPANVSATADGSRKLFNKWSYEEVEVKDISLQDYIQIRQHVYLPHTAGRFAVKRFRKAQVRNHSSKKKKEKYIHHFYITLVPHC